MKKVEVQDIIYTSNDEFIVTSYLEEHGYALITKFGKVLHIAETIEEAVVYIEQYEISKQIKWD